jgi:hypothetical protein
MPIVTPAISRAFIENVKLVSAPRRTRALSDTPPVELKADQAQSLVVGSSLVAAAENVPVETRNDLINCTLFAQLAASAAVSDPTQIASWYDAYFRALSVLGWAQSDTRFEEYSFSGRNAEAHNAIVQVLAALMGPQAAALLVVKAAIDALQSMSENSPWITLFDRQSKTGRSARFQVATAQLDPNGLLQTALIAFELKTRSTLTQVLFFKFSSSSTSLKYAADKATIYEAALKDQREAIAARLAAYRSAYVGEVKLPPLPGGAVRSTRRASPRRRAPGQ